MTWMPLARISELLTNRKWFWCFTPDAWDLKYIDIRVDTRDNCCVVKDRNGKVIAESLAELETLFLKLDADTKRSSFQDMRSLSGDSK